LRLAALAASVCAAGPALAQGPCANAAGEVRLQIAVGGVRGATGTVTVTVYPDDSKRFLASGARVARVRAPAAAPVTHACVAVPAPGHYAIAVYHDENGDRRFNRTALGLPAEGYGFSNDAPAVMGLPAFDAVRFKAGAGDTPLSITLRY